MVQLLQPKPVVVVAEAEELALLVLMVLLVAFQAMVGKGPNGRLVQDSDTELVALVIRQEQEELEEEAVRTLLQLRIVVEAAVAVVMVVEPEQPVLSSSGIRSKERLWQVSRFLKR